MRLLPVRRTELSVFDELKQIIARVAHRNEQELTTKTPLASLHLDSLNWVQVIVGVESTFDIEVDIDKMKKFVTLGDLLRHIEELME